MVLPAAVKVPRSKWTVHEILSLVECVRDSFNSSDDGDDAGDGNDGPGDGDGNGNGNEDVCGSTTTITRKKNNVGHEWLMQGAALRVGSFTRWHTVAAAVSRRPGATTRRTHSQCFLKWKRLLKPWRAIFLRGPNYWHLTRDERKAAGLPLAFNRRIYNAIFQGFDANPLPVASIHEDGHPQPHPPGCSDDPNNSINTHVKEEAMEEPNSLVIDTDDHEMKNAANQQHKCFSTLSNTIANDSNHCNDNPTPTPTFDQEHAYVSNPENLHVLRIEDNLHVEAENSPSRASLRGNDDQMTTYEENNTNKDLVHGVEANGLKLDKETIGRFLESINSMAKAMEAIVKALTK